MPIYEYQCDDCKHRFEEMQSITAEPLVNCPSCSKPKLRKLFGVPGLVFKGSGFYVNDYKKQESPPID